jgi:dTDP-4-dehydrorhamnose reductase
MAERRILVIGGTGQLGRELTALSWPNPCVVIAPPRSELDIANKSAVAAALATSDWTAVINAAAYTAVDAAEDNVADAFVANALGPAILAEETRRRGVPLIHVSTDYVFDGTKPTPYVEDDPVRPLGVYGASKLAGEEAVRTGNPRHLIVRTSWVFGRHGRNFVKTMLRLAREGKSVRVVDDQVGTPTSAVDLAAALMALAAAPNLRDHSGVYHFANAGETSWFGFASEIFALTATLGEPTAIAVPITTAEYPTPAKRPANSRLSTAKIEIDFGLKPRFWEEALEPVVLSLLERSSMGSIETLRR